MLYYIMLRLVMTCHVMRYLHTSMAHMGLATLRHYIEGTQPEFSIHHTRVVHRAYVTPMPLLLRHPTSNHLMIHQPF